MKGTDILINGNDPHGRFVEGIISGAACAPGMCMEVVPATEPVNGRFTYRVCTAGTVGDRRPVIVLLEDSLQGVVASLTGANVFTAGARCRLYYPQPGDELNMLVKNLSGTADTHAIGDLLMVDIAAATGKLLVQGSASQYAPFQLMETSVALTADALLACQFG